MHTYKFTHTFLYYVLVAELRALGKIVLPTTSSGITTSNIPTGRTSHSRFKIPIDACAEKICAVSKQSALEQLLIEASLIIWDEASMAKREDIESVDTLLKDLCENTMLFGDKVVVFGGDFRQVLPVLPKRSLDDAVCSSLVNSYVWPKLNKIRLTENIRARNDSLFASFLLQLGNGRLQSISRDIIHMPEEVIHCDMLDETGNWTMIQYVFPEIESIAMDSLIFNERGILTPTNEGVDTVNAEVLAKFPGNEIVYTGYDNLIDAKSHACAPDFLNTLNPAGISPYKLVLKLNCPVMLLRNLDPSHGLCNGTRLICTKFEKHIITCKIAAEYYAGELVFLPRIALRQMSTSRCPFEFQRKKFPIKLCFAMTINKSQGQALQRAALYLRESCFTHGQLYVACSRVKHRDNLRVFSTHSSATSNSPHDVVNVISFDVLKRACVI